MEESVPAPHVGAGCEAERASSPLASAFDTTPPLLELPPFDDSHPSSSAIGEQGVAEDHLLICTRVIETLSLHLEQFLQSRRYRNLRKALTPLAEPLCKSMYKGMSAAVSNNYSNTKRFGDREVDGKERY